MKNRYKILCQSHGKNTIDSRIESIFLKSSILTDQASRRLVYLMLPILDYKLIQPRIIFQKNILQDFRTQGVINSLRSSETPFLILIKVSGYPSAKIISLYSSQSISERSRKGFFGGAECRIMAVTDGYVFHPIPETGMSADIGLGLANRRPYAWSD